MHVHKSASTVEPVYSDHCVRLNYSHLVQAPIASGKSSILNE